MHGSFFWHILYVALDTVRVALNSSNRFLKMVVRQLNNSTTLLADCNDHVENAHATYRIDTRVQVGLVLSSGVLICWSVCCNPTVLSCMYCTLSTISTEDYQLCFKSCTLDLYRACLPLLRACAHKLEINFTLKYLCY